MCWLFARYVGRRALQVFTLDIGGDGLSHDCCKWLLLSFGFFPDLIEIFLGEPAGDGDQAAGVLAEAVGLRVAGLGAAAFAVKFFRHSFTVTVFGVFDGDDVECFARGWL